MDELIQTNNIVFSILIFVFTCLAIWMSFIGRSFKKQARIELKYTGKADAELIRFDKEDDVYIPIYRFMINGRLYEQTVGNYFVNEKDLPKYKAEIGSHIQIKYNEQNPTEFTLGPKYTYAQGVLFIAGGIIFMFIDIIIILTMIFVMYKNGQI